ncbi:Histidinol phosphatase and related hydrolases of the PHP family [uncultured Clostridium sp.]|uniref:PHP domain-containing protein n=1 Tax=uncultured Clostridium sp. TaxID=59620 RepID=UPI000823283F|nr:PHP domain-containing protein [uncultured Clostridium sp.]SCI72632.1 Histidinol phosphatase and related hydrolases of the PHP family [uncultured Clostridium sp.]
MIDLHLHTNLSDGDLSPSELISQINIRDITYVSVTDHNHSLFYDELKYIGNLIKPKLITGCEIATSYNRTIIEILGYNVDVNKINSWYKKFYSQENLIKNEIFLFNTLLDLCKKNNLKITEDISLSNIIKGCSKKIIYQDLIKHESNNSKFDLSSYKAFFRKELSNPESKLFLNEALTYPSLEDVIELIHNSDGLTFLAHPFEYNIKNLDSLIYHLTNKNYINGIECFHPSATTNNSKFLLDYCKIYNIFSSAGSDFHSFKKSHSLGVSINDSLVNSSQFSWLKI